ncbi:MAG: hypothetical protein IJ880_11855 [Bacilli bacterium]|nr:hypothetical protein [Bacilli bacterium]
MSKLGTVLMEMLIPDNNEYWDNISFEAGLNYKDEDIFEKSENRDILLTLYLNTYRNFNTGYLKSHSRMNVAKLRERVKEVLNLDKPTIEIGQIVTNSYMNQVYRTTKLTYKIDQELFKMLTALIKLKGKSNV